MLLPAIIRWRVVLRAMSLLKMILFIFFLVIHTIFKYICHLTVNNQFNTYTYLLFCEGIASIIDLYLCSKTNAILMCVFIRFIGYYLVSSFVINKSFQKTIIISCHQPDFFHRSAHRFPGCSIFSSREDNETSLLFKVFKTKSLELLPIYFCYIFPVVINICH